MGYVIHQNDWALDVLAYIPYILMGVHQYILVAKESYVTFAGLFWKEIQRWQKEFYEPNKA